MQKYHSHRLLPQQAKVVAPLDSGEGAMFGSAFANLLSVSTAGVAVLVLEDDSQVNWACAVGLNYCPPFKRVHETGTNAVVASVGVTF